MIPVDNLNHREFGSPRGRTLFLRLHLTYPTHGYGMGLRGPSRGARGPTWSRGLVRLGGRTPEGRPEQETPTWVEVTGGRDGRGPVMVPDQLVTPTHPSLDPVLSPQPIITSLCHSSSPSRLPRSPDFPRTVEDLLHPRLITHEMWGAGHLGSLLHCNYLDSGFCPMSQAHVDSAGPLPPLPRTPGGWEYWCLTGPLSGSQ